MIESDPLSLLKQLKHVLVTVACRHMDELVPIMRRSGVSSNLTAYHCDFSQQHCEDCA